MHRSTHSLSTTTPLAIGISFFSIVSLLTSNKISAHCWLSVKRLKTRSLGRTVCFLQIRSLSLFDVFPTRHPLQSILNSSKSTIFFKLISAPICTRSFPRGFSLATSNYVLVAYRPHCCKILCAVYTGFSALASLSDFVGCPKHQAESCWQISAYYWHKIYTA